MKRRKLIENVLAAALSGPGFNEGKGKPFSAEDIRFTQEERIYMLPQWAHLQGKF